MIQFNEDVCGNLDAALRREWLETNGLGGFASSTIVGLNTRRYHGLLVAALKPPVGRFVLLSKLEETLIIDGQAFELSANRYPGVVHPQGFRYLKQFRLDPFPVFTYEIEGIEIEKAGIHASWREQHRRSISSEEVQSSGTAEQSVARDSPLDRIPRLPQHHSRERRYKLAASSSSRGMVSSHSLSRTAVALSCPHTLPK